MEAKIKKREIIDITILDLDGTTVQLDFHYKSHSNYDSCFPCSLFISYDGELTESFIRKILDTYSGDYPVFHCYKTDKLYLSNVTQYMRDIFNIESEEVTNE